MKRSLKVFLAFALSWPITAGDKIAQLPRADAGLEGCSGPWQMYRGLASAVFGTSYRSRQDKSAAFTGRDRAKEPLALLLPLHPVPPLSLVPPGNFRRGLEGREPLLHWSALQAVPPPAPVFPFHLDSKK